jgi:1-aminocyclopropane-1-carboxylate deaminase/D-cysteine desulfhydrase-like pyridoxal-dependent ACC family enzyme
MSHEQEQALEQALAKLNRIHLASVRPTPLEAMPRLSAALGGPPLYIKRDDLTGLAFGGNKTRMLEFSLADAKEQGADTIVTGAAVQSNYCRQMAAACAKLGLELHLVVAPHREIDKHEVQGNAFLQRLFGATVTVLEDYDRQRQDEALQAKAEALRQAGKKVYMPRQTDAIDLDAIAYAESALEIVLQCREQGIDPEYLYVCALDTTQAGLVMGLAYLRSPIQVRGISPSAGKPERTKNMARIANQALQRLGMDLRLSERDFDNDDSWVGERYGIPTGEGIDALHLVAKSEGILLDPVYTSKAMAALIGAIRQGKLDKHSPVLFMHTGGAPALFGYTREVMGAK